MLNFFDIEQSRLSYNTQTEEFRHLNANLQTYLGNIRTIDDENRQVQNQIEQIRFEYLSTLENHLKRLPKDFHEQSRILTDAHLQRYQFKTRTRRLHTEREEIKHRIKFILSIKKLQLKYLNLLQKQERTIRNESIKLNEQYENLLKYVQNERTIHQQAMNKVDQLQIQLEDICVERSKREFEIQTLKEEVKLMETTREFLHDECEMIISTHTEANEYFLSHLNHSIKRIRDDFQKLHQNQLEQIENEYEQMLKNVEDNLQINSIEQNQSTSNYQQLQTEYQIIFDELTTLNNQNQNLSEQIHLMESDFYTLQNNRIQQLNAKDNELEHSKMALQTLSDKLQYLAEYDRNLKFELTLYRGVLESEYRRKQSSTTILRPTTLPTRNPSLTDRTRWLTNSANEKQLNNQKEENLITRTRVQSEYELADDETIEPNLSTRSSSNEEQLISEESLWQQLIEPFNRYAGSQGVRDDQIVTSQSEHLSLTSPILQSTKQMQSPTNDTPFAFEVLQSSSTPPLKEEKISSRTSSMSANTSTDIPKSSPTTQDFQTIEQVHSTLSRTSSVSSKTSSDIHPSSPKPTPQQEHQPSSRTPSVSAKSTTDNQISSPKVTTPIVAENPPPPEEPSSRTSSVSAKSTTDNQISSPKVTTPIVAENSPLSEEHQPPSRSSSVSSKTSSDVHRSSPKTTPQQKHQPSSRTSSVSAKSTTDNPISSPKAAENPLPPEEPSSRTSSVSAKSTTDNQMSSPKVATPIVAENSPLSEEHQPPSRSSSVSSKTSSDVHQSSPKAMTPNVTEHPFLSRTSSTSSTSASDVQQPPSALTAKFPENDQIHTSTTEHSTISILIENPLVETDENVDFEDSTSQLTDEKPPSEDEQNEHYQSFQSLEPPVAEQMEKTLETKSNESRSSSIALANTTTFPLEAKKETHQQTAQPEAEEEEENNSSHQNPSEENNSLDNLSSTVAIDYNLNESNPLLPQDISFTDVEEVDLGTSLKEESNLAMIMEDLREVFHDLANDQDLVEIDNDLPEKILDRLEFRDQFIRTLFESLIRKYLVQTAIQGIRSDTLDWIEFRDIHFPIITGRYTERHIRTLFDLFDTSNDGYLSIQEIAELLEILHAHDTVDLAQNIIDEYDTDHDGKLNVDELIEAFKKADNISDHALSEETENKQWFSQLPAENQNITLEVPVLHQFQSNFNENKFSKDLLLLGRIFKKLGADFDRKQLDSRNKNLSMQLTNEFIQNNISISNDDLQLFAQLYFDFKRRNENFMIDWKEFQEIFFPIITNGFYSKEMMKNWFEIFDTNQNEKITREQTSQFLHLLQVEKSEEIISILIEISDQTDSWTFEELIFILTQNDQTASHLLINPEQFLASFDLNWLSKNVFSSP